METNLTRVKQNVLASNRHHRADRKLPERANRSRAEAFFDQYLRSTKIPNLEYQVDGRQLKFQFTNIVDGFSMPVLVRINELKVQLNPKTEAQELTWFEPIKSVEVDINYLIESTEK